jgi:hypothetical protein
LRSDRAIGTVAAIPFGAYSEETRERRPYQRHDWHGPNVDDPVRRT